MGGEFSESLVNKLFHRENLYDFLNADVEDGSRGYFANNLHDIIEALVNSYELDTLNYVDIGSDTLFVKVGGKPIGYEYFYKVKEPVEIKTVPLDISDNLVGKQIVNVANDVSLRSVDLVLSQNSVGVLVAKESGNFTITYDELLGYYRFFDTGKVCGKVICLPDNKEE